MGRIRLTGATSGYTELRAANAAGNNTIILPTTNGGEVIVSDSSGNVNIDSGTFYVDASNNRVGVGISSPSTTLHVVGTGLFTGSTQFNNGIQLRAATQNYIYFDDALSLTRNGVGDRLTIDSSGRVGIGTSSPGDLVTISDSTTPKLGLRTGTTQRGEFRATSAITSLVSYNSSPMSFIINDGTDKTAIHIDGSQRVGIGITSVNATRQVEILQPSGYTSGLRIRSDGSGAYNEYFSGVSNWTIGSPHNTNALVFGDGSERARIDSSGRLLVGTSSAPTVGDSQYGLIRTQGNTSSASGFGVLSIGRGQAPASIVANSELGHIYFTANDGSPYASVSAYSDAAGGTNDYPGRLVFSTTADGASSPTERMRIKAVGTTNIFGPSDTFWVATSATGTGDAIFIGSNGASGINGGSVKIKIYSDGDIENVNNSYGALSDSKLKENIIDATSQWEDIKALQVRKYNFKPDTGHSTHTQIGLIAQEAELVSPGLVSEYPDRDEDGNDLGTTTKSVNYSVLYMKAVKALQEAMERIETLEASNADLLARVSALESA